MTIGEAQKRGEQMLGAAGIDSNRLDSALLLEKITGQPRSWLIAHADELLARGQAQEFESLTKQRASRRPLVHLTHSREFYGLNFYIDQRVLTPRVETEAMAEWAIETLPANGRLLDIGTGSGALAVAIKKHRPDLEVWASELSTDALAVAQHNAKLHKVSLKFVKSDLLTNISQTFHGIVTNLPYLQNDAELMPEVQKEPAVALFGGATGLELYQRLFGQLPAHLEPGAYFYSECDPWQQASLIEAAETAHLGARRQGYFITEFIYHV